MTPFIAALVVSFCVCLLIVLTQRWHGHLTHDPAVGVQKAHSTPVPRIGGLGIFLGLVAGWGVGPEQVHDTLEPILLAGLPAIAAGLLEDVTKRVGVTPRLLATMVSGLLICVLTGHWLHRLDLPLVDQLLAHPPVAIAFTAFAVAGLANAINLIDGFNGLASGTLAGCFATFAVVAQAAGDEPLSIASGVLAAATLGFWLVNYPFGRLFMGDGGAYFGGFALAWVAVLLPSRNPNVSPWESLLVCAYPVIETLYTVYRRLRDRQHPGMPDSRHLHSLLKTQWVMRLVPLWPRWARHALVCVPLWGFAALPAGLAIAMKDSPTTHLMLAFAGVVVAYHLLYQTLARDAQVHPIADAPSSEWLGGEDTPAGGAGQTGPTSQTGQGQRAVGQPAPLPTSAAASQKVGSPPPGSGDSGQLYGK